MRRLVLLTNEYPFAYGDTAFVEREIAALVEAFDEVHVFNCTAGESPSVPLPAGVTYRGNLYPSRRREILLAALSPRRVRIAARAWRSERRAGVGAAQFGAFAAACARGMRMAAGRRVRESFDDGADITLYSFWGLGGGLAVPWLVDRAQGAFVRVHRYDLYESPGYLPFRAHLYAAVDAVLAVSAHARDYIAERHPGANVVVSRLGTPDPGALPEPRGEGRPRLVVSCSHVIPVKRVERIFEAVEAAGQGTALRWVHFGGGAEFGALQDRVRSARIEVELRGQTPHDDVIDFYGREYVDAFINLSESEGVPVSIMEAMSFDIPIVATDVGGTSEIVTAEAGRLVDPNPRTEQVAASISEVLALRERFHSRDVWAELCDSERNSRATAGVLLGRPDPQKPSAAL